MKDSEKLQVIETIKNFRKLGEGEVRILFQRHAAHVNNELPPASVRHCHAIGRALKKSGIVISGADSSTAPRAFNTNMQTMIGYQGKPMNILTYAELGDMSNEPPEIMESLRKRVNDKGLVWGDAGIAQVAYDPEDAFINLMEKRGKTGADRLRSFITFSLNKTKLVTSHGVGRIENTLMVLRGESIHLPERLAECGQIIELIFNLTGTLIEENWLDPIPA